MRGKSILMAVVLSAFVAIVTSCMSPTELSNYYQQVTEPVIDTDMQPTPTSLSPESSPAPAPTPEQTPIPMPIVRTTPEPGIAISPEARERLIIWWGELGDIIYMPEKNRPENGVELLCFKIHWFGYSGDYDIYFYIWIDPYTGDLSNFEEPYLYSSITNTMLPVPMIDGEIIPYDRFVPPVNGWEAITYIFVGRSIMDSYRELLLEAGFEGGAVDVEHSFREEIWDYRRYDGALFWVDMYHEDGNFVVAMGMHPG